MRKEKDLDSCLTVEAPILLKLGVGKEKSHQTVIRGWHKDQHILLDRPRAPNGTFIYLQAGQRCQLHFLKDGSVCALVGTLLGWDNRKKTPYLRISWPKHIENISIRKHQRIEVDLPCHMQLEDGELREGRLLDLSQGGCGILSKSTLPLSHKISLNLNLPDQILEKLRAEVRNVRRSQKGFLLGCSFEADQLYHAAEVSFFLHTTVERIRSSRRQKNRVLLVEDEPGISELLYPVLEAQGLQVSQARTAVDAFHRLRLWRPRAMILGQSNHDLSGIQMCKAILHAEPQTLLFLYGCDPKEFREAENLGIKGCFSHLDPSSIEALTALVSVELEAETEAETETETETV